MGYEKPKNDNLNTQIEKCFSNKIRPSLNPKKTGGGFPPQDIRALAMLLGTKLWLSNLCVIIIFGVYNKWKTND